MVNNMNKIRNPLLPQIIEQQTISEFVDRNQAWACDKHKHVPRFFVIKLKSSFQHFCCRHNNLVSRYGKLPFRSTSNPHTTLQQRIVFGADTKLSGVCRCGISVSPMITNMFHLS